MAKFMPSAVASFDPVTKSRLHNDRSDSGSLNIKQQFAEDVKVIKIRRNATAGEDGETIYFDDLEYLGKLGGGNCGLVTKVRNKRTGAVFALKQMELDGKHVNIKNVLAEYNSMHQNSCPYIMSMYGVFYREPSVYMLLEYMDCGSLESVLRFVDKIPEDVLAKIAVQLLKGLKYMHEEKVTVHRDLKPANILVNSKGEVKISDFGLAGHRPTVQGAAGANAVEFTTYAGTLSYMSPERIGSGTHSLSSDIWSIGLTLAECALGYFPYRDKVEEFWAFMKAVTEERVQLEGPGLSPDFQQFIWDCMAVNPEDRPTASQLLQYDFIARYKRTEPSFKRWLHDHFILPKKHAAQEKKQLRTK